MQFNIFVQVFNFFVVSAIVYACTRLLIASEVLSEGMANGMVVCSCLPMTISSVAVLTKISGGDEAAAIFNSACSNLVAVFLSPALILGYVSVSGEVDVYRVFVKIALRVVLPVVVGQFLQKRSQMAVKFVQHSSSWV